MIEKMEVEGLLKNTESLSGCSIKVGISKTKLTLTGTAHTIDQKGEAGRIAWKAIGVWTVANEIVVD
jgi:osmotically-inducible protein OsmY